MIKGLEAMVIGPLRRARWGVETVLDRCRDFRASLGRAGSYFFRRVIEHGRGRKMLKRRRPFVNRLERGRPGHAQRQAGSDLVERGCRARSRKVGWARQLRAEPIYLASRRGGQRRND